MLNTLCVRQSKRGYKLSENQRWSWIHLYSDSHVFLFLPQTLYFNESVTMRPIYSWTCFKVTVFFLAGKGKSADPCGSEGWASRTSRTAGGVGGRPRRFGQCRQHSLRMCQVSTANTNNSLFRNQKKSVAQSVKDVDKLCLLFFEILWPHLLIAITLLPQNKKNSN